MEMSQLQQNDLVLTMNPQTGEFQYSPVIMWLDRDLFGSELYVELTTKSGRRIRLTSSHLIYVSDEYPQGFENWRPEHREETNKTTLVESLNRTESGSSTAVKEQSLRARRQDSNENQLGEPVDKSSQTGNANNNRKNNNNFYYYYSLDDHKAPTTIGSNGPAHSLDNAQPTNKAQTNGPTESWTNKMASLNVEDYAYTVYSRNAIVGQYLLVRRGDGKQSTARAHDRRRSIIESHNSEARQQSENVIQNPSRLVFKGAKHEKITMQASADKTRKLATDVPTLSFESSSQDLVEFDQIISINYVTSEGLYAPLTRQGNIVVDSVVASCYALVNNHEMAHMSFAPIRWFSYVNEWFFGLKPETPTIERTIEMAHFHNHQTDISRSSVTDYPRQQNRLQYVRARTIALTNKEEPDIIDSTKTDLDQKQQLARQPSRHIHWYAILLYNIARFLVPLNYMY